jgi:membrane associated rhomboid family serine protease
MECKGCGAGLDGDPLSRSWTCGYCATVTVNERFLSAYIHRTDFTAAHHLLQAAMAAFDAEEYAKAFSGFDKVIATDSACVDAWAYGAVAAARLATAQNFEQQARTSDTWMKRAKRLDPAGDVVVVSDGVCRQALSQTAYRALERNLREGNSAYFAFESIDRKDALRRRTECFERAFGFAARIFDYQPADSSILAGTIESVLTNEPKLTPGQRLPALVTQASHALETLEKINPVLARSSRTAASQASTVAIEDMSSESESAWVLPATVCGFTLGILTVLAILNSLLGLGRALALIPVLVLHGELWRLVTYPFVVGLAEWVSAAVVFSLFGLELERIWGSRRFLMFLLSCTVGGALALTVLSQGSWTAAFGPTATLGGILVSNALAFPNSCWRVSSFTIRTRYVAVALLLLSLRSAAVSPVSGGILLFFGSIASGFAYLRGVAKMPPDLRPS